MTIMRFLLLIMRTIVLFSVPANIQVAAAPSFAEERPVAVVNRSMGKAGLKRPGSDASAPARRGDEYFVGDVAETGPDGGMQLVFPDGAYMVLGRNTALRINQYAYDTVLNKRTARVRLLKGKIRIVLFKMMKNGSLMDVVTDHAIASPSMASDTVVDARAEETLAAVLGGDSGVRNASPYVVGSFRLTMNMKSIIRGKTPPAAPGILTEDERAAYLKEFRLYE